MRTLVKLWLLRTPSTTLTRRPLDNPLEIAVLNLFITMKYRFPNLVVGMLTRESVRKALSNGISADQVRYQNSSQVINMFTDFDGLDHQLSNDPRSSTNAEKCNTLTNCVAVADTSLTYVMAQNPLLPVTVQDQIRLWELERNRLKSAEGPFAPRPHAQHMLMWSNSLVHMDRFSLQGLRFASRL